MNSKSLKVGFGTSGGSRLSVKAGRDTAEVRIIGYLGFETGSEDFRRQIDELASSGVKNIHLYINSPGGSCFDAAEIVNILSGFGGTITGEGGALVASAATYIALHCKTFTMPENGMFMIHKPTLAVEGTETEIESNLSMLRKVQDQYYTAYRSVAKNPADFEGKWNAGDNWMTAAEAKEAGFITGVTGRIGIDRTTAAMVAACGCPVALESDLRAQLIALLGLKEDAADEGIIESIKALLADPESVQEAVREGLIDNAQADSFAAMAKADPTAFSNFLKTARETQGEQIDKVLQKAAESRPFIRLDMPVYRAIAAKIGLQDTRKLIDTLPEPCKPMDFINSRPRSEWGLKEYRKFAPEELAANPALYASLMQREGHNTALTADTLEYYRRNNPEYLEAHPEEYKRLLNRNKQQ